MGLIIKPVYGTDPEFFLIDRKTGAPVAAPGIIPGEKFQKHDVGFGCTVEPDNVAAEIGVPPTNNIDQMLKNIDYARGQVDAFAGLVGALSMAGSSAIYDDSELQKHGCDEFGCNPTYDGYTLLPNMSPDPSAVGNLRTFGFHIHLGWEGDHTAQMIVDLTRLFDLYVGVPGMMLDPDETRRQLYGKSGEVRMPDYGIEYRVLGGNLLSNPTHIRYAFEQTGVVVDRYNDGFAEALVHREDEIRDTIDTHNRVHAAALCREFDIFVPA